MIIIEVILFLPIKTTFFYYCHPYLNPKIGSRVYVPFKNKKLIGIISKIYFKKDKKTNYNIKYIIKILDTKYAISNKIINLLHWTAKYYHCPIGILTFNILPKLYNKKKILIFIGK
ncbi:hypothetical protein [Buchnera aphidicola]|uniref:Primosomal protein N' 3' DNA-binding domain-containing protein n=1 Tax=Buchnera aphidicola (Anoecia oenotherae) TaxID=1241833 RepID=A0A4D6XYY4_9GAMM|nr:hypothetical protein [Buchnera aphidicola]QCI19230.1 hypothetical protein D9V65_00495 [Buchnera aphidicola (Anoecia oenotherae)]